MSWRPAGARVWQGPCRACADAGVACGVRRTSQGHTQVLVTETRQAVGLQARMTSAPRSGRRGPAKLTRESGHHSSDTGVPGEPSPMGQTAPRERQSRETGLRPPAGERGLGDVRLSRLPALGVLLTQRRAHAAGPAPVASRPTPPPPPPEPSFQSRPHWADACPLPACAGPALGTGAPWTQPGSLSHLSGR